MSENRYYVYEWYVKDTDEVFYVGKGTGCRAQRNKRENKFFNDMYNSHDCDWRIVKDNLAEDDAFNLEIELIKHYRNNTDFRLTNVLDGGDNPPIRTGLENHMSRQVDQYSLDGILIKSYDTISDAIKDTGITGVGSCARGEVTHAGGYVWSYADKKPVFKEIMYRPYREVVQLDLKGNLINVYRGSTEAGESNNLSSQDISTCCVHKQDTAHGFVWLFKDEYDLIEDMENFLTERFKIENTIGVVLVDGKFNVKKFQSVGEAASYLEVSQSSVSSCLIGQSGSCNDHVALYEKDYNEQDAKRLVVERLHNRYTRVAKLTLDNEFVRVYDSLRDAGRNGFDHSAISKCCRGVQSKHKGFKWMYYKNYIKAKEE